MLTAEYVYHNVSTALSTTNSQYIIFDFRQKNKTIFLEKH